jgi:hypothetical protein
VKGQDIDILFISYNRPEYTSLALPRLLETCDETMRVWLWHNGTHVETLKITRSFASHPRVHRFYHSVENLRLLAPTNWLWREGEGAYLSKVDDDCLLPDGWAQTLRRAHQDVPEFGILGCWRFFPEDFVPELAERKIRKFAKDHRVLLNFWVEGSGYLMKRACLVRQAQLLPKDTFTTFCIRRALEGWINGWYYPFIEQEHMDDPRSPHSLLRSDEDLERYMPLSAGTNHVQTLEEWQAQLRRSARLVQDASIDLRQYRGWRPLVRRVRQRTLRLLGKSGPQW